MKKFSILFATVALIAMTACNEKPAKNAEGETTQPATEQVDTAKKGNKPTVNVERAKPTEDGKDHTVAEFKTDKYQVKLKNLADGTFRLSLADGGANQIVETKNCVMQGGNYLMKADDGKVYIITAKENAQQLTIMTDKEILYNGKAGK